MAKLHCISKAPKEKGSEQGFMLLGRPYRNTLAGTLFRNVNLGRDRNSVNEDGHDTEFRISNLPLWLNYNTNSNLFVSKTRNTGRGGNKCLRKNHKSNWKMKRNLGEGLKILQEKIREGANKISRGTCRQRKSFSGEGRG